MHPALVGVLFFCPYLCNVFRPVRRYVLICYTGNNMTKKVSQTKTEIKPDSQQRKPNACHTSTARLKNWKEVYASVADIQQFLDERVLLRYNLVTHQTEVHWLTEWGDDFSKPPVWERINDRVVNNLMYGQRPVLVKKRRVLMVSQHSSLYRLLLIISQSASCH